MATMTDMPRARAALVAAALAITAVSLHAQDMLAPSANAPIVSPDQSQQERTAPPVVDPRFDSPRATMFTFLGAMDHHNVDQAAAALDLPTSERDAGPELAAQLLDTLNRLGVVFKAELPDRSRVERDNLRSFTYFPRDLPRHREMAQRAPGAEITLVRTENGQWKFSAHTLATITDLWRKTDDIAPVLTTGARTFAMRVRSVMPSSLRRGELLDMEYWQWLGLALLIFLAAVIDFAIRFLARATVARWASRKGGAANSETLDRLARPVGLFAAALFGLSSIWALGLPATALAALLVAIRLTLMIAGVWSAFRATDLIAEVLAVKASHTATRFDDLLVPLARKSAKIIIFAVGLIYIANSLRIEILPLITGLGIGGLAVAFAAKDTIENFFGSIAVVVDRPFEVGDWVLIGDIEGTVEELGFRSTRIRTFYNSQVTIPNATLVRATVDNYGRRRYRRFKTTIGVSYNTDPDAIDAFCAGVRELIRQRPMTRKDYYHVWLNDLGASSLNVLLYMFFEAPDWATELRERHRFTLDVLRLAHRLNVEIAFPTQTIYLRQDETPQAELPEDATGRHAARHGADVARSMGREAPWRVQPLGPVLFGGEPIDPRDEADPDSQIESRAGGDE